jgi:phosphoribosylaminoimidazole-succinocarboxamide synthase
MSEIARLEEAQELSMKRKLESMYPLYTIELVQGSSKNIYLVKDRDVVQFAIFENTDEVSIFDIGRLLDLRIEGKGITEALMTRALFIALEKAGIGTHLLGCVDENTRQKQVDANDTSYQGPLLKVDYMENTPKDYADNNEMYVEFADVLKESGNCMIPFEVITRFAIIEGVSSCTQNEKKYNKFRDKYLDQHKTYGNLPTWDDLITKFKGQKIELDPPLTTISSKYEEEGDRPMDASEANELLGVNSDAVYSAEKVAEFSLEAAKVIREELLKIGIDIPDIKVETALKKSDDGNMYLIITDVVGVDEIRMYLIESILTKLFGDIFEVENTDYSKQIIRDIFKEYSLWCDFVLKLKNRYANWKDILRDLPVASPKLNPVIRWFMSKTYNSIDKLLIKRIQGKEINTLDHLWLRSVLQVFVGIVDYRKKIEKVFADDLTLEEYQRLIEQYQLA